MGSGAFAPGFGAGVGGGDQMPFLAGRRQEFAGLLLARAVFGHFGGPAQRLQRGFAVEERLFHRGPQSSSSGVSPPLARNFKLR